MSRLKAKLLLQLKTVTDKPHQMLDAIWPVIGRHFEHRDRVWSQLRRQQMKRL